MSGERPGPPQDTERVEGQASREHDVNALIPVLAHGFTQRLDLKGLRGQVRIQAMAGEDWAVGTSPDNPNGDIPNVIVYPREALQQDSRLLNARLRHEIGNLNYPIEAELGGARNWAAQRGIAPELVTSLAQVIHEPSVNYLEMRNAASDQPQENFRALYEEEVKTSDIAERISEAAPYKQALDLSLLYGLTSIGLCPRDEVEAAFAAAHPDVQQAFDAETQGLIDKAIRLAVPSKQMQLVLDDLWPRFSHLASLSGPVSEGPSGAEPQSGDDQDIQDSPAATARQIAEVQDRLRQMMEKMRQPPQKPRAPELHQKDLSPLERQEKKESTDLLAKSLQDQLQNTKNQFEELQNPDRQPEPTDQPDAAPSMEDIGQQAEQVKQGVEEAIQAQPQDQPTAEQLEKLKEELEQLEEIVKQITESGALEDELEKLDEDPITYNIKEIGIDESQLTPGQLSSLEKIRGFAQHTSRAYRTTMRLLMTNYQQRNPNFNDRLLKKMMEHGHDVPDFSIYGPQAGADFLAQQDELGIDSFDGDLLVNFNLPRPLGRFWYKGGGGNKSQPVRDGEIEWGHFYRASMPVIWSAVDRSKMSGLYLDRLNEFGQHDPNAYYYLWNAINVEQLNPDDGAEGSKDSGEDETQGAEAEVGHQEGGQPGASSEGGDGAIEQLMGQLARMQQSLQAGADPQELAGQLRGAMQQAQELMVSMGAELSDRSMPQGKDGQPTGSPAGEGGSGSPETPGHETFQEGGQSNNMAMGQLFQAPDPGLIEQLRTMEAQLGNHFAVQDAQGNITTKTAGILQIQSLEDAVRLEAAKNQGLQADLLDTVKQEQQARLESFYRDKSGLNGEALRLYAEYSESTKNFTDDLTEFFVDRFKLDRDAAYARNQQRGVRLQSGYQQEILGVKDGRVVIQPAVLERKYTPDKPQFCWTLVIDNSGSCEGEIIEQEKKLAVSLIEVAKRLDVPIEVVTFGGPDQYTFLKTFEDESIGEDLQKIVLLQADQGTPDVTTLEAACNSMARFAGQFRRSYNFVYFMTDGQSGGGSIQEVIAKHKRDMVITGIGLADAAKTISETWGKNALAVPDITRLSTAFVRKVEEQIDETFD